MLIETDALNATQEAVIAIVCVVAFLAIGGTLVYICWKKSKVHSHHKILQQHADDDDDDAKLLMSNSP